MLLQYVLVDLQIELSSNAATDSSGVRAGGRGYHLIEFRTGWSLFLADWSVFLTGWSLFLAGWSLFLAGSHHTPHTSHLTPQTSDVTSNKFEYL